MRGRPMALIQVPCNCEAYVSSGIHSSPVEWEREFTCFVARYDGKLSEKLEIDFLSTLRTTDGANDCGNKFK